jgi:hypothetical protein
LVNDLLRQFGRESLTIVAEDPIAVDFISASLCYAGVKYELSPVGTAAQELVLTKGLENWIKIQMQ